MPALLLLLLVLVHFKQIYSVVASSTQVLSYTCTQFLKSQHIYTDLFGTYLLFTYLLLIMLMFKVPVNLLRFPEAVHLSNQGPNCCSLFVL